jgi:fermentation-respiration switch protein FrsA (DUF1100 family)
MKGRRLGPAVLLILGVLAIFPLLTRSITNSMLFHPSQGQSRNPGAVGLGFSTLTLAAEDGTAIEAWWIPYRGPAEDRGITVVTFHGNAGTMADRLEHTRLLHDLGVSILTVEYRGYGNSEGSPSEDGLAMDARAGLAEARRRGPANKVVIHGRSLGGAVATRLAATQPADGLIIESTFTSLADMAGRTTIPLARRLVAYNFDSLSHIRSVTAPVLVVHGEQDELIPLSMGETLRDAAGAEWLAIPGGLHNDTWVVGGAVYWQKLASFFGALAR